MSSDPSLEPEAAAPYSLSVPAKRRVVFVVGSGRSGTSTMSGALQTLGMHVPQPEVVADETNPKGFGEPQWVVDLHTELLQRCNVAVSDARPAAWFEAGRLANIERLRTRLHTWLEEQFAEAASTEGVPELVVKDPRLAWFLGLWRSAALRCEAAPAYVTMLRPVTEVVGSKQRYYSTRFGEIDRTAAWVNMMLHTERATRGSQRAFVRYEDLLTDWTIPLFGIGQRFDLFAVKSASANDIRKVHQFIDPGLRRVQLTWDDVDVPARLRDIAEESWQALNKLADDGVDGGPARRARDPRRDARGVRRVLRGGRGDRVVDGAGLAPRGLRRRGGRTFADGRRYPRCRPHPARPARAGAGFGPPGDPQSHGPGASGRDMNEPDIACLEGYADYDVRWAWHDAVRTTGRATGLKPGLTCVFRVKNEARNLPWVLPPMFESVQHVVLVDNESDDGTPEVAQQVAASAGAAERFTLASYPFRVSRAGTEHLTTPPDSVHSLTHFYNWSFSHVRTTYSMKWDGDMVLTREGVGYLADLSWQLEDSNAVVAIPRHPLSIVSESEAWIDLGYKFLEPWVYPMGPEFTFVKAFEWEVREFPDTSQRIVAPEGLCVELKWLDADEFAHWSSAGRQIRPGARAAQGP